MCTLEAGAALIHTFISRHFAPVTLPATPVRNWLAQDMVPMLRAVYDRGVVQSAKVGGKLGGKSHDGVRALFPP
jgi:hypothetical protein